MLKSVSERRHFVQSDELHLSQKKGLENIKNVVILNGCEKHFVQPVRLQLLQGGLGRDKRL